METTKRLLRFIIGADLYDAIVKLAKQEIPESRRDEFIIKVANHCAHLESGADILVTIRRDGKIKQFAYIAKHFAQRIL